MAWEDEDFSDRDEEWRNAKPNSFEKPPDGEYQMECTGLTTKRAKKNDHRLIIWEWRVLGGRCQGMKTSIIADVDSPKKDIILGILKGNLAKCGIEIEELNELRWHVSDLVGQRGTLKLETKEGYPQNATILDIVNPAGARQQENPGHEEPERGPYGPPPPTDKDEIPF